MPTKRGSLGVVWVGVFVVGALLLACSGSSNDGVSSGGGGPPADIAGKYTVSVTNTNNGCNYANWKIGESSQNIAFDITQTNNALSGTSEASGTVQGLANIYFALLGIGTLKGTVNGSAASMSATGTNSIKQLTCAYFVKAQADITLTGNTINGTMTYSNVTNHDPTCGNLETCTSQQSVAGSRPPK